MPDRDLFGAVMQHIPDSVFIKDTNGRYLMVNPSMVELLGAVEIRDVIGKTDDDFLTPEKAHNNRIDERHIISSGMPILEKTEYIQTHNKSGWYSFTKAPLLDNQGHISGLIGIGRDISDHVLSEKRERARSYDLKAVVEIADRLIASADLDTLLRKAIELARSHLRVERCSILLNEGDHLKGTYGTDLKGMTTDERHMALPFDAAWENRFKMWHKKSSQWIIERDIQRSSPDARLAQSRDFWVATTPIKGSNNRVIGVFCNDTVISGSPPDERLQDVLAVFCSLLGNIIERQRGMDDLRRRDQVLEGVARSASQLLIEDDFDAAIHDSLKSLGESTQVDRVYIFKNHLDPLTGEWMMSQRYEWSSDPAISEMKNDELQDLPYEPTFSTMFEALANGRVYGGNIASLSEPERQHLEKQKILSILLVPIHIRNQFWGFIGLDDCHNIREWSTNEKAILLAMAGNLGGAISRETVQSELKLRDRILSGVAKANHELLTNVEKEIAIPNALRILAGAVNVERIYICENLRDPASGNILMCLRHIFHKDSYRLEQFGGFEKCLSYSEFLPGWHAIMSAGKPIHGRLLDFFQHDTQSVRSVLLAPLMIENKFWGIIGFDTSDSEHNWSESDVSTLSTMAGSIGGAIARQRAEDSLRKSEEHFRSLIENASDLILVVNHKGDIVYGSPSVERELGYLPDKITTLKFLDIIHPDDQNDLTELVKQPDNVSSQTKLREFRLQHQLGHYLQMECAIKSFPDETGNTSWIVNSRDITQRINAENALRHSEELLRHSQKMEAIGRLAGGIAHDFNNLLTAILGYGDLLLEKMTDENEMRSEVQEIHKAANRAHGLTRQLLAFSRRQIMEPICVDLNSIVADMERLLKRLISENIVLKTDTSELPCTVKVDRGQIEQVIVNLALNAKDAMIDGGELGITTEICRLSTSLTKDVVTIPPGEYVLLAISDTGHGISEDIRPRIFEPFFTTKEVGKGTGLGLSMVYGTIEQSGGYILYESVVNTGTKFSIYLPLVNGDSNSTIEVRYASPRGGNECILLVEDEPIVRDLSRRILSERGYRVVTMENGLKGLEYFRQHPGEIDVILTDIIMPRMSGLVLARSARQIKPDVKVLFMSGYTEDQQPELHETDKGKNFIQKPFTVDLLCGKLRELLDNTTESNK
ncbi:MAG TPA: PAS domain S-box protein [Kiritimatiellia bacterium]|nr:PAS domain S-box protein [Kiritimatiellia bacterium]